MKSPKAPAPPPVQEPQDIIDNINKTITKTVTNPDGTKQTVIERMPLTPEEQAYEDQLKQITETNLQRIEQLSQTAMAVDIPEFANTVNQLRDQQTSIRDKAFGQAAQTQEKALARSGLANSSSAAVARDLAAQAQREAVSSDSANLNLLAEDLRQSAINRSKDLLSTSSALTADQMNRLTQASQFGAGLQQSTYTNANNVAQQQYASQLAAFNSRKPSFGSQLLGAAGTLGGAYLGGLGMSGAGLGSIFGGASPISTWVNPNTGLTSTFTGR